MCFADMLRGHVKKRCIVAAHENIVFHSVKPNLGAQKKICMVGLGVLRHAENTLQKCGSRMAVSENIVSSSGFLGLGIRKATSAS